MANRRGSAFLLTPPSVPLFLVAVVLAVLAMLVQYGGVDVPVIGEHVFNTLAIAFAILTAGVLLRGV